MKQETRDVGIPRSRLAQKAKRFEERGSDDSFEAPRPQIRQMLSVVVRVRKR
ncbi:MAG: hypothetical protein IPM55_09255 [Acidobacteria bacterium]|nr:hypothetical protein [Acidobacteriota bacterium]